MEVPTFECVAIFVPWWLVDRYMVHIQDSCLIHPLYHTLKLDMLADKVSRNVRHMAKLLSLQNTYTHVCNTILAYKTQKYISEILGST